MSEQPHNGRILSREYVLELDDHQRELVHVPEWGGSVWIGTIRGNQRDAIDLYYDEVKEQGQLTDDQGIRAHMIAAAAQDEHGNPLFKPEDMLALGNKSSAALDRLFRVARRINKIYQSDIEETVKNSNGGPSDDSGSN